PSIQGVLLLSLFLHFYTRARCRRSSWGSSFGNRKFAAADFDYGVEDDGFGGGFDVEAGFDLEFHLAVDAFERLLRYLEVDKAGFEILDGRFQGLYQELLVVDVFRAECQQLRQTVKGNRLLGFFEPLIDRHRVAPCI